MKPVQVYSHNGGHCSVTGGYVYRGSAVPAALYAVSLNGGLYQLSN